MWTSIEACVSAHLLQQTLNMRWQSGSDKTTCSSMTNRRATGMMLRIAAKCKLWLPRWTSYLSISVKHLVLEDHLPADLRAVIHDDIHVCPCTKLPLPVGDGGQRGDDEEGSTDVHVENLEQKSDWLNGLPQPHLICQYAVFSRKEMKTMCQNVSEGKWNMHVCHREERRGNLTQCSEGRIWNNNAVWPWAIIEDPFSFLLGY